MDSKTKVLFAFFFLAVVSLGSFCYYKYVLSMDYTVYAESSCDPSMETCFIYNCDPEAEECTGDPEEDTSYYKEVQRRANQFPNCDPNDEDCLFDRCWEEEVGCNISLCDPSDPESVCTSVEDFISEESSGEDAGVEADEDDAVGGGDSVPESAS